MTQRALPDGFVVRLHDDVELESHLFAGPRVLRLSDRARSTICDRTVTVGSPLTAAVANRLLDLDLVDPVIGPQVDRSDDVTVVVPVRDHADGVDRLLEHLAGGMRCVVVDDASADPAALAAVAARHGARLVRLDHNVGPSMARNAGLARVTTPLVAFVDADVTVCAPALAGLTRHFADPRLAAVAPRIMTASGRRWFQRYDAAHSSLDLGAVAATVRPRSTITYLPTACLVARVDALGPGFDPTLRSGEDVDLVWRLQDQGFRVRYAAEAVAHHETRGSMTGWLGRKAFYGTSAAPLAARHAERVAPALLSPATAVVAGGSIVGRRWSVLAAVCGVIFIVRHGRQGMSGLAPRRLARSAAAAGLSEARQVSALMLRHWWPISLLLAVVSPRFRRVLVATAVVDGVVARCSSDAVLDTPRFILARRADDVAYGAGVWWGAARGRSAACLAPQWLRPGRRTVSR